MAEHTYRVEGMTCSHCVAAITGAVRELPGIASATVDLEQGQLVVGGTAIDDATIVAAVDDAGYAAHRAPESG